MAVFQKGKLTEKEAEKLRGSLLLNEPRQLLAPWDVRRAIPRRRQAGGPKPQPAAPPKPSRKFRFDKED